MQKFWKNPSVIGNVAYWVFKILNLTLRNKVYIDSSIDSNKAYLFAFWHGKQLLPSFLLQKHHNTPMCAMVSPSRDGGMLSVYLKKCGFAVIRGSSRSNNIAALIKMKNKIAEGSSVGFAVDGPIGPIYEVKPGIVYLAQKYDLPIIIMGSFLHNPWTFNKAWDKFQIPKPLSRNVLYLDKPFVVPKDMSIEDACKKLAEALNDCERKAGLL